MKKIGETLFEIMCDNSEENMSYSGRGMFGERCMAFSIDGDVTDWAMSIVESIDCDEELMEEFLSLMRRKEADTLGMGMVVYFPGYEYPGEEEEEEE